MSDDDARKYAFFLGGLPPTSEPVRPMPSKMNQSMDSALVHNRLSLDEQAILDPERFKNYMNWKLNRLLFMEMYLQD